MTTVIQLEDLPLTDRVEVLREHVLHAPVPLELRVRDGVDLIAKSSVADFGEVHLLSSWGTGATLARTPRLSRDGTEPSVIVSALGAGRSVVFQDDRLARLEPGVVVIYATTSPYWLTFETGTRRDSFQISLSRLGLPLGLVTSQLALPLVAERPLAEIVAGYLRRTAECARTLAPEHKRAREQPLVDLVRALIAGNAGRSDLVRGSLTATVRERVLEYSLLHLRDRELGAPKIAAALGISERYVYAVARSTGTSLGEWIREQRVRKAAELLADPALAELSIAAVAHRYAFADHAHFTRTFRALRGMTPSEWRHDTHRKGDD